MHTPIRPFHRPARLLLCTATAALGAAALAGCAGTTAPPAQASANHAEKLLAKGQTGAAITAAEQAVLGAPRNPSYRAVLASTYLQAGRFQSAVTSFDDAMELGDGSTRTALSLALALIGSGQGTDAVAVLDDWRLQIAPSDLGLAYALAGRPDQGVALLTEAVRGGDTTAKTRQNLAYTLALAGRWAEAKMVAAQDVPANELDGRLAEWAGLARPEASAARVAHLLDVPLASDPGQPAMLALANTPSLDQLAAEARLADGEAAVPPALADQSELPALAAAAAVPAPVPAPAVAPKPMAAAQSKPALAAIATPAAKPAKFAQAFATPSARPQTARAAAPVATQAKPGTVRPVPATTVARSAAPVAAPATASATPSSAPSEGHYAIQLGSFSSRQGARRAIGIYASRHAGLAEDRMAISEAVVRGKRYYRVTALGYGAGEARSLCGAVKATGHGCIAFARGNPLPGAVRGADTRLATR